MSLNILPCRYFIAENIAFGIPFEQIDMNRVRQVAQQAQIWFYRELWF